MAILLLTFVRADLLEAWDQRLPENTPNRFLINIQLSQLDELGAFMDGRGLDHGRFMPMARARLESINGRAVSPEQFEDPFARRMVMRAANLAWADELGPDNRIVQGRWWSEAEHGSPHLSVEADYAAHLGIGLGDTLTYQVGGRTVAFEVTSLRKVSWDSFRPNFFLLTTPGVLDPGASTYITSLHVPPDDLAFRPELVSRFPNVTDINVAELLGRVRDVLDRLSMAMEFIFLFTVAAGIVVLLAAIVTSREERRREVAVLRTFGASRRQLRRMFTAEFAILGALAGVIGCLASAVTGWAVARWLLELELRLSPSLWLAGVGGSVVVITVAGLIAMWSLMRTPPWRSIQLGA